MKQRFQIADYRNDDGAHPWLNAVIYAQAKPPLHNTEFALNVEADSPRDALIETMVRAAMLGHPPQRKHLFRIEVFELGPNGLPLVPCLEWSPDAYSTLAEKTERVNRIWREWKASGFHVVEKRRRA